MRLFNVLNDYSLSEVIDETEKEVIIKRLPSMYKVEGEIQTKYFNKYGELVFITKD